jgi:hypothetical protein
VTALSRLLPELQSCRWLRHCYAFPEPDCSSEHVFKTHKRKTDAAMQHKKESDKPVFLRMGLLKAKYFPVVPNGNNELSTFYCFCDRKGGGRQGMPGIMLSKL